MTDNSTIKPVGRPARRTTKCAAAAQRRRRALQSFLDRLGMSAADLARTLGLSTANSIYNHLHGRSASLSLPLIEAILDHFDSLTFEELTGRRSQRPANAPIHPERERPTTVPITAQAVAGLWLPPDHPKPAEVWSSVALAPKAASARSDDFAVLVGVPGAEAAYPAGSLLVCRRPSPAERLKAGSRVVLHRLRDQRVEVSVREVVIQQDETWLMTVSTHPELQHALRVPVSGQRLRLNGPDFHVAGIVTWAWIPQPGAVVPPS